MKELSQTSMAYPTCPHCGHSHGQYEPFDHPIRSMRWHWEQKFNCVKCGKEFTVYPCTLYSTVAYVQEDE